MSGRPNLARGPIAAAFAALALLVAVPAAAGPITVDTYYQFAFEDVGSFATGCDPADPSGPFCVSSSGTPTEPADAPPWTFTAGTSGATLTVTDAFASGDRFQIFDFGASLGMTSASAPGSNCGDDPVPCLADPDMSHGAFAFASGAHSITIAVAAGGFGSAYFLVAGDVSGPGPEPTPVPEPATLYLVTAGAAAALGRFRRRS